VEGLGEVYTCPYNSQGDLFNFIITAYGIHPSCGHAHLQRGSYTNKHLIKNHVAPEQFWGLIHQGTRPRINPCPRHGYPGTFPGALDISRDFDCLVPDQEPQSYTGGPYKGLLLLGPRPRTPVIHWGPLQGSFVAWSPTMNPNHLLGALTRVFCHGTDCLFLDQEPQECTGGPRSLLGSFPSSRRMALATALNSTLGNCQTEDRPLLICTNLE
jgi:hypothetical protein